MLDENLSDRIVSQIEDLFPGSAHVKAVGLREADDAVVWEWAKQNGFTIVSKDTDFHQRAIVLAILQNLYGCVLGIPRPG
jgi:predicted nuclease of predicted toxin-antitoxin system